MMMNPERLAEATFRGAARRYALAYIAFKRGQAPMAPSVPIGLTFAKADGIDDDCRRWLAMEREATTRQRPSGEAA